MRAKVIDTVQVTGRARPCAEWYSVIDTMAWR